MACKQQEWVPQTVKLDSPNAWTHMITLTHCVLVQSLLLSLLASAPNRPFSTKRRVECLGVPNTHNWHLFGHTDYLVIVDKVLMKRDGKDTVHLGLDNVR